MPPLPHRKIVILLSGREGLESGVAALASLSRYDCRARALGALERRGDDIRGMLSAPSAEFTVAHRARVENLSAFGQRRNARRNVDCDPQNIALLDLDLPGMKPTAHINAE
jgi:hypothetical protein